MVKRHLAIDVCNIIHFSCHSFLPLETEIQISSIIIGNVAVFKTVIHDIIRIVIEVLYGKACALIHVANVLPSVQTLFGEGKVHF